MEKKKILEFRFGKWTLLIPFSVLFAGIIWLALTGKALPMAFWTPTLGAMFLAIILAKKPSECAGAMVRGMANEMVAVMLMAWFLAGIVAKLLQASGLIDSLIWLCLKIGLSGGLFPAVVFIIGCLLSTSTGTAIGTVIALAPILAPVGAALGSNMPVLLGAIVCGAYFGDNIAPVSDTTIASAYTQDVEVAEVVRSRLKYAFVASGLALVLFVIFGMMNTTSGNLPSTEGLTPNALVMLFVPILLIIMMFRGANLLVALMISTVAGLIVALAFGFIDLQAIMFVDLDSFSVSGIITDGVMNLMDVALFAFFLMGLINLLEEGGIFEVIITKLSQYAKSPRSAEIWVAIINIVLNILTVASTIVIIMEGPLAKRLLVQKYKIRPEHSANMLDAVAAAAMCLIPYGFSPMLAYMFSGGVGGTYTVFDIAINSFYGYTLMGVMFFSMITGWGRKFLSDKEHAEFMERDRLNASAAKDIEAGIAEEA